LISNCSRRDELFSRKGFDEFFFFCWLDRKKEKKQLAQDQRISISPEVIKR
jgi:hypothetical protein